MATTVFGAYDQAALDLQYDNQRHYPDFRQILAQGAELSAAALPWCTHRDVPWGDYPDARLDIYRPAGRGRVPVVLYVHGGAWVAQNKEESAFAAQPLLEDGCMLVTLGFPRASQVSFDVMVQAVREGVAWVRRNIASYGGDADRIVLIGHSSGSHLVSQCLTHDWAGDGLPTCFAGAMLVCGLGDLEPVRLSYRNERLKLNPADVQRYSLLSTEPTGSTPVVVAVADGDTDEFRRQSEAVAQYCRQRGLLADYQVLAQRNHFDVILDLCERSSSLYQALMHLVSGRHDGSATGQSASHA